MKLKFAGDPAGIYFQGYKHCLTKIAHSFVTYHPTSLFGRVFGGGERNCTDRWNLIAEEIRSNDVASVVDLGCAEGYFVRLAAAEFGCFALGIDGDVKRLLIGQNISTLEHWERAGSMLAELSPDLLARMPVFDMTIFLSVLHHVMYEKGLDYSRAMLVAIREKTRKVMVFDMGQSNETSNDWAGLLPDMGDEPEHWIHDFLLSAGFSRAERIGEFDAYRTTVHRIVFSAFP